MASICACAKGDTEDPPVFKVKLLNDVAKMPTRGSTGAAGYDLAAVVDGVIPARGRALVSTGVAVRVPSDHYARIAPRSGLTVRHGIDVGAGVIDSDYTGEIKVALFNHDNEPFQIKAGDRVAQLIFERISTPALFVVDVLEDTERGDGGFGSTSGWVA